MSQHQTTQTIRTRFAPSPTGYLHIGGARTALFSWLFARQHHGIFILRIEDTDLERSTPESIQAILNGMEWLGLDYDEGPYYQTQRFDRYKEVINQMVQAKTAYRCYCSKERLEKLRETQLAQKQKPKYDGHCRQLDTEVSDKSFVVRFKNPTEGEVTFIDLIKGQITINNNELDDLIVARSDGTPTYNFTVVIDDWDMKITHVIRGDDHINNTPRQINILKALGVEPPLYGHVPMILGNDGKRLSKRHGAVSVLQYREEGYLPESLINYLVRLGWSFQDQEIFSRDQMIQYFNAKTIQRAPAAFNPEKLSWLNQHYMKTLDPKVIAPFFSQQLQQLGIKFEQSPDLERIIKAQAERCKNLKEMAEKSRFFFQTITDYEEKARNKFFNSDIITSLKEVRNELTKLSSWTQDEIHSVIKTTAEKNQLKLGDLAQPIRLAITGSTVSPPLDTTLFILGETETVNRLNQAISYIENKEKS